MTKGAGGCIRMLSSVVRLLSVGRLHPAKAQLSRPKVLAIVQEGPNQHALQAISEAEDMGVIFSSNCHNDLDIPPIVIYERELSPARWSGVIQYFARKWPRPYIILLSSIVDANLWEELQRAGGSDILRTPIDSEDLIAALKRASQLWRSLQRVRALDAQSSNNPLPDCIED